MQEYPPRKTEFKENLTPGSGRIVDDIWDIAPSISGSATDSRGRP
jgi:hypothetical protein